VPHLDAEGVAQLLCVNKVGRTKKYNSATRVIIVSNGAGGATCQFLQLTSHGTATKYSDLSRSKSEIEENIMTRIILSCFVLAIAFMAGSITAFAQVETANGVEVEKDLALVRRNLRAEKKQLIALNVALTETEATKFWPVYDEYVAEMAKANDEFYAVIKDYAANQKTLTDAQASSMIKRWAEIQVKQAQVRQKYIPLVEKVIPGRKAALFFQIDRRLYALMDLQVASQIPLVAQ
jgi:hypothetical protein